jgi:hypothetical protein
MNLFIRGFGPTLNGEKMFEDDIKRFKVVVEGRTPLIMHNCQSADPENQFSLEMAPLKAKRKKTDLDRKQIRDISFLSCLYWSDELKGLYIPTDNLRKMLLEAGRACDQKGAKKQIVGVSFTNHIGYPLNVKNRSDIEKLKEDPCLRYNKVVTISKAKVPSVRAIFNIWSFEFEIEIDCSIIDPDIVHQWLMYSGKRVGLGGRRPYGPTPGEFGKFSIEEFKETK